MFLGEHLVLAPVYGTRMIVLGIPVLFAGLSGDWKSFQSFAIHLNGDGETITSKDNHSSKGNTCSFYSRI